MKISDITVGCAYTVQSRGIGVVVDIGKFAEHTTYGDCRTLEWNGTTFTFQNWYSTNSSVTQRRVAIVMLSNNIGQLLVLTPAQLMYATPDEYMKQEVAKLLGQRTKRDTQENWSRHKENYGKQIRSLVTLMTPDVKQADMPYWERENAYARLLFSSVLPKMILLYLQYHQMKDEPVNGHNDVETLIDTFRDSVSGLRGMVEAPTPDIDAITAAAMSHISSVWKTCSPVTLTKAVKS